MLGSLLSSGVVAALLGTAPRPLEEPVGLVPPAVKTSVEAERPQHETQAEVRVLLLIDIDAGGEVSAVRVLRSGGADFDAAAASALLRFSFQPATQSGVAVPVQIEYEYVFEPEPEPVIEAPPPTLEIDDYEEVRAPPPVVEATQRAISADEGDRLPGVQGDAVKAARTLPGVARAPVGDGGLVIWGAAPSDTRLYIDWVPVPSLFHLGGARSVLPSAAVKSISVVPAAAGPGYGRALGGFVRATTLAPRRADAEQRAGGFARLDVIDAGAGADRRVGERGWVFVALRRGMLPQTYGRVVAARDRQTVPIPSNWDYQSKAHVQVGQRASVELLALGSSDTLVRGLPTRTPDLQFRERRRAAFHRVGTRFSKTRTDGSNWEIAAWGGVDRALHRQSFGSVNAVSEQRAWRGGVRIEERRRLAPFAVLTAGVDAETRADRNERDGALTLPRREGDLGVFGQPPGDRVASDSWRTVTAGVGLYGSVRFEFAHKRVRLEPGLRLEPLVATGDRVRPIRPVDPAVGYSELDVAVDPRLRIEWTLFDRLTAFAAGARVHQAAASADRSPVFGAPTLGPAQAYQAVAGLRGRPSRWLNVSVEGFFVRSSRLAARSAGSTPPVAQSLVNDGDGRNFGGQISAQLRPHATVSGRLAYAWTRAERRGGSSPDWRLFDFDQTHHAQAMLGWNHRSGVELGARVVVSSGYPRTPVIGATANARTGQFDPVFGAHNSDRLPTFFELSLRLGWGRSWAWGALRTWVDVQNATNRRNAQEYFYSASYDRRGTVRGLPVLPVVGLELRI